MFSVVVFFPDRVSKLRAPCIKCTALYLEKINGKQGRQFRIRLSTLM